MSENEGGFAFPFPFLGMTPEEARKLMEEQAQHNQMVVDDFRHSITSLFDALDREQLTSMKNLLHVIVVNSQKNSRTIPAYYEGIVSGLLHTKFNVCHGCEKNHDEVLAQQLGPETEKQMPPVVFPEGGEVPYVDKSAPMDGGNPFEPAPATTDLKVGEAGMLSDMQLVDMEIYNLDDLRDEETGKLLGFLCNNCKTRYVSIEDRKLRPADKSGCSGCVQKEQWG